VIQRLGVVTAVQARVLPEHPKYLLIVPEGSVLKQPAHGGFSATLLECVMDLDR
jgi:hypothetical protein